MMDSRFTSRFSVLSYTSSQQLSRLSKSDTLPDHSWYQCLRPNISVSENAVNRFDLISFFSWKPPPTFAVKTDHYGSCSGKRRAASARTLRSATMCGSLGETAEASLYWTSGRGRWKSLNNTARRSPQDSKL